MERDVDGDRRGSGGAPLAEVRLSLAGDPNLIRLARLAVSGVASVAGLSLDESEQCRAAVDELCNSVLEVAPSGTRLTLVVEAEDSSVTVRGAMPRDPDRDVDPTRQSLGGMILDATVGEWTLEIADTDSTFHFRVVRGSALES